MATTTITSDNCTTTITNIIHHGGLCSHCSKGFLAIAAPLIYWYHSEFGRIVFVTSFAPWEVLILVSDTPVSQRTFSHRGSASILVLGRIVILHTLCPTGCFAIAAPLVCFRGYAPPPPSTTADTAQHHTATVPKTSHDPKRVAPECPDSPRSTSRQITSTPSCLHERNSHIVFMQFTQKALSGRFVIGFQFFTKSANPNTLHGACQQN